ncbi:MAG: peptidylprolyl isomerase [Anaerolineae bacterium]
MRPTRFPSVLSAALLGFFLFLGSGVEAQTGSAAIIQEGSRVSLEYTLSDEKGGVIESNKGKPPLSYTHGQGQIIRGLEDGLKGMRVGEQKTIQVKPEDGYGPVSPRAFREVPRENIPPDALKVGTMLVAQNPQGQGLPVRVYEIKEETVVLDLNHPLAGKTLTFNVTIVGIEPVEKK